MCLSYLVSGEQGNLGEEVHVWASGGRAKQVNQQAGLSPGDGGQEKEAPAAHLGVPLKPSEAPANSKPQSCQVSHSQELDLHEHLGCL